LANGRAERTDLKLHQLLILAGTNFADYFACNNTIGAENKNYFEILRYSRVQKRLLFWRRTIKTFHSKTNKMKLAISLLYLLLL
jgi:hypothetical protein